MIAAVATSDEVIDREGRIDLVKIDTERNERAIVMAIPDNTMAKIGHVYCENNAKVLYLLSTSQELQCMVRQSLAMNVRLGRQGVDD